MTSFRIKSWITSFVMLFFDILWPVQSSYKLKFSLKNSANQRKVGWLLALEVMLYGWPWIAATVFQVYITVCVRGDCFNTWSTSKTTKVLHLMYIIVSRRQCNPKLIHYYTNDWKQQENKKDWSICFTVHYLVLEIKNPSFWSLPSYNKFYW